MLIYSYIYIWDANLTGCHIQDDDYQNCFNDYQYFQQFFFHFQRSKPQTFVKITPFDTAQLQNVTKVTK